MAKRTSRSFDQLCRQLATATTRRQALGVLVSGIGSMLAAACVEGLTGPSARTQTGHEQCAAAGALYCNSASVPWTLEYNVPGTCCLHATNANASVGYLCAYGSNRQPIGCYATVEEARYWCPSAPSIVRCTRG